jgi:hypothetical protein
MAEQKALGDQMLRDTAAFGQALVAWAESLERREKNYRARAGQQKAPALLSFPSVPMVTGGNGLMPDESGDSAVPANGFLEEQIRQAAELGKREQQQEPALLSSPSIPIVTSGDGLMPDELGDSAPPGASTAQQQNAATEDMMRVDPPIASDPISESLTLVNLAGIPAAIEGVGGLVAAGASGLAGLASDAVGGITKAVEQRLEGGAASPIVPGGGLQASENLGGHLLAKHLGQTEAQLMSRAMTDPLTRGVASAFFDRATAETAASQAVDANASNIGAWLAGNSPLFRIFGTMTTNVGRVVTSEGVSVATRLSRFILVRDATSSTGYYILTGYPY